LRRSQVLNLKDPPDAWRDQRVNATILAGLGFFTTLASISAAGIRADPATSLLAAGIAAGLEFFVAMAIQRGLYRKEQGPHAGP